MTDQESQGKMKRGETIAGDSESVRPSPESSESEASGRDPVRIATLLILTLCLIFFTLYLRADRVMPYSTQARVVGRTVSIVPQVGGYITSVKVGLHEVVDRSQVLVEIDTLQYQIGVRQARANLDNVIQQIEGAGASVAAAVAGLTAASAQENITRRSSERVTAISELDPTAISQADRDRSEAAHLVAIASVEAAKADLRRAEAILGSPGMDNPAIRAAAATLEQAELNLSLSTLTAPSRGAIESMFLEVGHFASPGQPLMTFVSASDVLISANMRENNLANMKPGNPVEFILDVAPGKIFNGTVRSIGLGVSGSAPNDRGTLPKVTTTTGWLRQPQQFPVVINLADDVAGEILRIGAQVSVMVYTGDHPIVNRIGRFAMRVNSILSYLR
jgi:multidrug resistance efflux pump